jgi:beta-1,4-mannosyl-glycoprotein beta-1,4-N-acetylglucosaminyltransferase
MIFDCFTFFNELDILDIRLHEMAPVIDKFVLVEATRTFQGQPKPLHYADNKQRYARYSDKIIHVVVDFPEELKPNRHQRTIAWAREHFQRDQIGKGLGMARAGDLIIVSDVDEIVAADRLREAIRIRRRHDLTVFTMPVHAHFVNRRVPGTTWIFGPRMIEFECFRSGQSLRSARYRVDRPETGSRLRRFAMRVRNIPRQVRTRVKNYLHSGIGNRMIEIPNSGWHLSSIGDWDRYRQKINAYSHAEHKEYDRFNDEQAYYRWVAQNTADVPFQDLPLLIRADSELRAKLAFSTEASRSRNNIPQQ